MPEFAMIDALGLIVLLIAIVQGWKKGLIIGFFSLICGLVGLAAAVKLSAVTATHLRSDFHMDSRWLPVLAFVLVFLLVLVLISLLGRVLERVVKMVLLGWLNKLGGMLLFILLYTAVYSIILFYGSKTQLISDKTISESRIYPLIASFGPAVIRFITRFIPYGHDMFTALEGFFDRIAHRIR